MQYKKRKTLSWSMILFELRNVTGNPYVHIFGIGMPILMAFIITRVVASEVTNVSILATVKTTVFLGIGALIPMATILMGYAVSCAQEMEKGIPQRLELFGVSSKESLCNRAVSEGIFMLFAFLIYFLCGALFMDLQTPVVSGAILYAVCIIGISLIFFCLAHALAALLKRFGITYCVTMMIYFGFMILSGMMGITYENMPAAMQTAAKLLPTTYINRDFISIWKGESYNFVPMLQSYLFFAAAAGILLFISMKQKARKLH